MHPDDVVPLRLRHGEEHPVAQDPRVVDDDVQPAEGVDGLAHDGLAAVPGADVVGVGDRGTARRRDLVDHLLGRAGVAPRSVAGTTDVVHDDLRAVLREQERVLAADAAAGTGDDAHPVAAAEVVHLVSSSLVSGFVGQWAMPSEARSGGVPLAVRTMPTGSGVSGPDPRSPPLLVTYRLSYRKAVYISTGSAPGAAGRPASPEEVDPLG